MAAFFGIMYVIGTVIVNLIPTALLLLVACLIMKKH